MVALDFFTPLVVLTFLALMGSLNLIALLITVLMLLYGIAGAYQPSVQASIPVLVSKEHFMAANSVINTISSFSALIGPVLGGHPVQYIRSLSRTLCMCGLLFYFLPDGNFYQNPL